VNLTSQQKKAAGAWTLIAVGALAFVAFRHRSEPEPVEPGVEYTYQAAPADVDVAAAAPSTTATSARKAAPVTTTAEARPATTPAPAATAGEADTVAAQATCFLHGWVLRGTWDERSAALKDCTDPEYLVQIFPIDPDLAGLPPGTAIIADPARVTITDAGAATAPATVDGFAVTVHEVRTAAGWRVTSHEHK
jgi:hypothetical protein